MRLRVLWLAAVLGAAVGLLAAVYLLAVSALTDLLWDDGRPRLPVDPRLGTVLLCALGGVAVGALRMRQERDPPHDLEDALAELDEQVSNEEGTPPPPPPSPVWLARSLVLGVVSLGFGASLGPEAPLVLLATGFGARIARLVRLSEGEAAYLSASAALSGLFGGPLGGAVLPVERSHRVQRATPMLAVGIVSGVAGLLALLLVLPDGSGVRYVMPDSELSSGRDLAAALGWAALGAVPATMVGLLLIGVAPWLRRVAEAAVPAILPRAVLGGVLLGLCGAVAPLSLFSGHHEAQELIDGVGERTSWALIGLAAVKLVATLLCLATGWFGGQVFPAIFAGIALGLVLVELAPGAPVGAVAAAGAAASTTAALRRPLASVLLLLFFFPPTALPGLAVGAALAVLAVGALGDRAPRPTPLTGGH